MMPLSSVLNTSANLENSAVATGLERVSFHSNPKKDNAKEYSNYCTIVLNSHVSKVILEILQAGLQKYLHWEFPDVKTRCRKGRGRGQIADIQWIMEKTREFQKKNNIYFSFIYYMKDFDYVDHNKLWKILEEMGIPDHFICLLRTCIQVKKQQLEHGKMDWFKTGKEYNKAVYCDPAYLTYLQSTSCEMPGWMKYKLESRLLGEISTISDMQMLPLQWQNVNRN